MKAKKVSVLLCAIAMVTSLLTPAMAAEAEEKVIDFGDGFYMIQTVEEYAVTRSGDIVGGKVSGDVYNGSTKIGTATLSATFDISGATAKALTASITGTGMNGWSFSNGGTRKSGNRASGTARFKSGSTTKSLPLTLTCSPDGTIS